MLSVMLFILGWIVFVYLQMTNSLRSSSNGLNENWSGMKTWLVNQSNALVWRAFMSAMLYPAIVKKITDTMEPALAAAGLQIYAWGFSGLAGFGAYGALYQITGLFSFFRGKEMHEVIPPEEDMARGQGPDAPTGKSTNTGT